MWCVKIFATLDHKSSWPEQERPVRKVIWCTGVHNLSLLNLVILLFGVFFFEQFITHLDVFSELLLCVLSPDNTLVQITCIASSWVETALSCRLFCSTPRRVVSLWNAQNEIDNIQWFCCLLLSKQGNHEWVVRTYFKIMFSKKPRALAYFSAASEYFFSANSLFPSSLSKGIAVFCSSSSIAQESFSYSPFKSTCVNSGKKNNRLPFQGSRRKGRERERERERAREREKREKERNAEKEREINLCHRTNRPTCVWFRQNRFVLNKGVAKLWRIVLWPIFSAKAIFHGQSSLRAKKLWGYERGK